MYPSGAPRVDDHDRGGLRSRDEVRSWREKLGRRRGGAVARWKRSGLTAAELGAREDVSDRTLRWWSSKLSRGTRAERGSMLEGPIELVMTQPATSSRTAGTIEVVLTSATLRVEIGTDVEYVAALVARLSAWE